MKFSAEHSTLYQIGNLTQRTNVVKKTKKITLTREDFLFVVPVRLIVASALEVTSIDGFPADVEEDVWLKLKRTKIVERSVCTH